MTSTPDSSVLRSSLCAYLEELADSGVEGYPADDLASIPAVLAVRPKTVKEPVYPTESGPPPSQQEAGGTPENLEKIRKDLGNCQRCKLGKTRQNLVFGVGNPHARLVFVGEGPGADEDAKGEPFVGDAGKMLNRIITAMGITREDVYICNVVKCRPPGNRDPEADEISACSPFLLRQIQSIKPEVIVGLGKFASQTLLNSKEPISKLRGKFRDFHGIPLMPTYHPSYLLRSGGNQDAFWDVWDDVTQVLRLLKLPVPEKSRKG